MKNLLHLGILGLLCLSSHLSAQVTYTPFDFTTGIWEEDSYGSFILKSYYENYVDGDTIINDQVYQKLMKRGVTYSYDSPSQIEAIDSSFYDYYFGAIRENDQRQVFLEAPGFYNGGEPILVYDFNLSIGDTMQFYRFETGNSGGYDPAVLVAIDTVEVCGTLRNRYRYHFTDIIAFAPEVTEGIGSKNGLIPLFEYFESGGSLRCYSNLNCECGEFIVNTTTPSLDLNSATVFPNPSQDGLITVRLEKAEMIKLQVYDHLGQLVHQAKENQAQMTIDGSHWPAGCYFLQLEYRGKQQVEKLIVTK